MTLPTLPPQGNTNWYDWAQAVHSAVTATPTGGTGRVDYVTQNSDGSWPNRSTSSTTVRVIWQKVVTASADPAAATAPAVTGMYQYDMVIDAS